MERKYGCQVKVVEDQTGSVTQFEVTLQDGTVIFSGETEYLKTNNLRNKYPEPQYVVEQLKPFIDMTNICSENNKNDDKDKRKKRKRRSRKQSSEEKKED